MTALAPSGTLRIGASDLEYRMIGPAPADAPTIVMLHEGLGSAGLWGDFPDRLAAATGAGVLVVFARRLRRLDAGDAAAAARLHACRSARNLAEAARRHRLSPRPVARPFRRGFDRGDLCRRRRRSPGARGRDDRAAFRGRRHVGIRSIAEIRKTYETTGLRSKLERWHRDVDNAFYGWNDAWLDPEFRSWDISRISRLHPRAGRDRAGRRRPVWDYSPDRDRAGRVLLSGRCDDYSGRRTFAASRSAGGDARFDRGIR